MVDWIKSTISNISIASGISNNPHNSDNIVGNIIKIPTAASNDSSSQQEQQLKVKRELAQGGYGIVYLAQDIKTGKEFALKRMISSIDNLSDIKREINIHKSFPAHPNIVDYFTTVNLKLSDLHQEFLVLTEYCPGGNLAEVLPLPSTNEVLSVSQVFKFYYQTVSAISHLHNQSTPIIHRDIKVENLLLDARQNILLCDFGSATTEIQSPDASWSAQRRGELQETISKFTTPMYRSPEMLDIYSNLPIDTCSDIWALGCLLYNLCFLKHPFMEGSTLPILNAQYYFPDSQPCFKDLFIFKNLIQSILKVSPLNRPVSDGIIASLFYLSNQANVELDNFENVPQLGSYLQASQRSESPSQPPISSRRFSSPTSHGQANLNSFLEKVKDGAGNIIRNIKETSSQLMRNSQLSFIQITSRILISSLPDERSMYNLKSTLDKDYKDHFLIFNLSGQVYDTYVFEGRVADLVWPKNRSTPDFLKLLDMCRQIDGWLQADKDNIIVLQDSHDLRSVIYLTVAYFLYCGLYRETKYALNHLGACIPPNKSGNISFPASLKRYYRYVSILSIDPTANKPHRSRAKITKIEISPAQLQENIQVVIEVICRDGVIYTSLDNFGDIHTGGTESTVSVTNNTLTCIMDVPIESDVQIKLHSPCVKKLSLSTNLQTLLFTLQIYTGFLTRPSSYITFTRKDFDSNPGTSLVLKKIDMRIHYDFIPDQDYICPIESVLPRASSPVSCCSSKEEMDSLVATYTQLSHNNNNSAIIINSTDINNNNNSSTSKEDSVVENVNNFKQHQQLIEFEPLLDLEPMSPSILIPGNEQGSHSERPLRPPPPNNIYKLNDTQLIPERISPLPTITTTTTTANNTTANNTTITTTASNTNNTTITTTDNNTTTTNTYNNGSSINVKQSAPRKPKFKDTMDENNNDSFSSTTSSDSDSDSSDSKTDSDGRTDNFYNELQKEKIRKHKQDKRKYGNRTNYHKHPKRTPRTHPPPPPPTTTKVMEANLLGEDFGPLTSNEILLIDTNASDNKDVKTSTQNRISPIPYDTLVDITDTQFNIESNTNANSTSKLVDFDSIFTQNDNLVDLLPTNINNNNTLSQPQLAPTNNTNDKFPFDLFDNSNTVLDTPIISASHVQTDTNTNTSAANINTHWDNYNIDLGSQRILHKKTDSHMYKTNKNNPTFISNPYAKLAEASTVFDQHNNNSSSILTPRDQGFDRRGHQGMNMTSVNLKSDAFEDILKEGGFLKKEKDIRTLNEIQPNNLEEVIDDPDKFKVLEWSKSRKGNIRSLIASLHTLSWEGVRWKSMGIHEMMDANEVNKAYKKACLAFHPDKLAGSPHQNLAKHILVELNAAHTRFESEGSPSIA